MLYDTTVMISDVKYQPTQTEDNGRIARAVHASLHVKLTVACAAVAIWAVGASLFPVYWEVATVCTAWCIWRAAGWYVTRTLTRAQRDLDHWFGRANLRAPQVVRTWPTERGQGYYLQVTGMADAEHKPLSVARFAEWDEYVRDLVGDGVHSVQIERCARNGGKAVMYVNRLPPLPEYHEVVMIGDDRIDCASPEEYEQALNDLAAYEEAAAIEQAAWLAEQEAIRQAGIDRASVPNVGIQAREPLPQPLSPQDNGPIDTGEGIGDSWAPPSGSAVETGLFRPFTPAPALEYPGNVWTAGEVAREVFDLLRSDKPVTRGWLAAETELSERAVSAQLAAWKLAGHVEQIGITWRAIEQYRSPGTIIDNGHEEASPGA